MKISFLEKQTHVDKMLNISILYYSIFLKQYYNKIEIWNKRGINFQY
jgi:hypothetical protein